MKHIGFQEILSNTRLVAMPLTACLAMMLMLAPLSPANAQEFECSVPGDKRFIRLELPGQEHLCEVSVTHAEGDRRVMWYANNETLFCSAKIYELRQKYEDQWNFTCGEWLDTGGIDKLSERHRSILDSELKSRIETGKNSQPTFRVTGVKAVASNPLNLAPGNLALQYFMVEEGSTVTKDITHVIYDDGNDWRSVATLNTLSDYIVSEEETTQGITSALVHEISDAGVLHVNTTLDSPVAEGASCQGNQTLLISEQEIEPSSPHRVVCPN